MEPRQILAANIANEDHDAIELRFFLPFGDRRSTRALAAATVVGFPVSVFLAVVPGAMLVEWTGWWLVNERVLAYRWGVGAVLVFGALFLVAAVLSQHVHLRLDRHTLSIGRRLGRALRIRLADVEDLHVQVGTGVRVDTNGGPSHLLELPTLDDTELYALCALIRQRLPNARAVEGDERAVPHALREIRTEREGG